MKTQMMTGIRLFTFIGIVTLLFNRGLQADLLASTHCASLSNEAVRFAPPDTGIVYQEGDTISAYTAGGDSIYVLYEDSISDSAFTMGWDIPFETEHMIIELTNHFHAIENGLLGVNLTDFFEPGHANAEELSAKYGTDPTPWDHLSDMRPKVLRFPSGAGGKFYQPLGSVRTNPDDPYYGMINGGYGIDIDAVIRFYDYTDVPIPSFDAPPLYDVIGDPMVVSIEEDMVDRVCNNCNLWMNVGLIGSFEDNYNKWKDQPVIDPVLTPTYTDMGSELYVNQLIDLVHKIESEQGYQVEVLLCLNILTDPAAKAIELIEYLRDHDIQIAGVELGNEVYLKWAALMMGFKELDPDDPDGVSAFIHYWDYINGHEYDEGTTGEDPLDGVYGDDELELSTLLPVAVLNDHDYIGTLKTYDPTIKVGLPASNFNHCADWDTPFVIDDEDDTALPPGGGIECECAYPDWNTDMETKFSHTTGGGGSSIPKFDAIILHNYYVAGNAWEGCDEHTNWLVAATEPTFVGEAPYDDPWALPGFDPDLGVLFEGIAGIPTNPDGDPVTEEQVGNFKAFVKDRIKNGFDVHALHLNFLAEDEDPTKEVWFTEYNLLPKAGEADAPLLPFVNMVPNTLAHAIVLQNWIL